MLTIEDLKQQQLILFEAVSGSRAYGLATAQSDTDIKGVFYLPRHVYYGLNRVQQVSNASNDVVYYELGRFVELLLNSNPNTLELLAAPADCIRQRSPLMDVFDSRWFVSLACRQSFAGYAIGQVKKARGLNKKIVNPLPQEKKTVLDFCHIICGTATVPLQDWLAAKGLCQQRIGLTKIAHARDLFAVFYDADGSRRYHGIMQKNHANNLSLSSIPAGEASLAYLSFNQDGYSSYCREYASYWQWVAERNEARFLDNQAHSGGYDAKNMMHTFRLLEMARDIARYGEIRVRRHNRDALLAIKNGAFSYEALTEQAEILMGEVEALFAQNPCGLPETTDRVAAEAALVAVRGQLYGSRV